VGTAANVRTIPVKRTPAGKGNQNWEKKIGYCGENGGGGPYCTFPGRRKVTILFQTGKKTKRRGRIGEKVDSSERSTVGAKAPGSQMAQLEGVAKAREASSSLRGIATRLAVQNAGPQRRKGHAVAPLENQGKKKVVGPRPSSAKVRIRLPQGELNPGSGDLGRKN